MGGKPLGHRDEVSQQQQQHRDVGLCSRRHPLIRFLFVCFFWRIRTIHRYHAIGLPSAQVEGNRPASNP